jgi:hypothetical protein
MCCTPRTAYDLNKVFPESTLIWGPDAGHSANVSNFAISCVFKYLRRLKEPSNKKALIEACDLYAKLE